MQLNKKKKMNNDVRPILLFCDKLGYYVSIDLLVR